MPGLRWTAPSRTDDAAWLDLLAAIEAVDRRGETYTAVDIDDEWESVWAHPETDATFVWEGGELVAFGWCKAMPGAQDQHQVECWGGVRPDRRRHGIGGALLDWQLARGHHLAAGFEPDLPTRVGLTVLAGNRDLVSLATDRGFAPVRRFVEVSRTVTGPLPASEPPGSCRLVDWSDALDEPVRVAHAEAFADHWGSEPRTVDQWRQWYTGHRGFRSDLGVVAMDGDDVAGFVLCAAYPADWTTGPREAWITSVGTRTAWRRRGLGRAMLAEVLTRVAASGTRFERAILGVDDANPTGARHLYRALGFVDERVVISFGLDVPSGGAPDQNAE